jgi:hypothetical protein
MPHTRRQQPRPAGKFTLPSRERRGSHGTVVFKPPHHVYRPARHAPADAAALSPTASALGAKPGKRSVGIAGRRDARNRHQRAFGRPARRLSHKRNGQVSTESRGPSARRFGTKASASPRLHTGSVQMPGARPEPAPGAAQPCALGSSGVGGAHRHGDRRVGAGTTMAQRPIARSPSVSAPDGAMPRSRSTPETDDARSAAAPLPYPGLGQGYPRDDLLLVEARVVTVVVGRNRRRVGVAAAEIEPEVVADEGGGPAHAKPLGGVQLRIPGGIPPIFRTPERLR